MDRAAAQGERRGGTLARDRPCSGLCPPASLALGMTARVPGLLSGAWAVTRAGMIELWSSPGLKLLCTP